MGEESKYITHVESDGRKWKAEICAYVYCHRICLEVLMHL
jgi:hypothetical protein